ncbi:hypothetical protein [Arthrobacter antioxidans]|uniref:hypothetical protein n=1 Tax=Arthrobacter antioxidans TaxID=2895818 RepID=UPI001FFFACBF|nr:hypothetical protein [Arthrobacter antioxidans]
MTLAPYSGREVPVCAAHKTSLDDGAPWMANPGTATGALSGTTGSVDVTILMGQDLPQEPRVKDLGLSPTIGSEVGFSVSLVIDTPEGEQQVTFWLTEDQGRLLGSWLSE